MHAQHQHSAGGYGGAGSMTSRPQQGTYSPPLRQGGHSQMFMAPSQRGGRGRNGAGTNFHRMSLPNGSLRLPAVQTQFGPYEYPVPPLSAMPFQPQPYMDSMVLQMLKGQIEYYFSIENLCKDMFLRKRMDSQGFVNLQFVAAFKRIRELTSDMGMIRAVCESSPDLEFVVGEDEVERIRRRSGWQNFVLPMHERDSLARNNGPVHLTFKSRAAAYNSTSPYNNMAPGSYGMSSPLGYNGDTHFQPVADAYTTGMSNGTGGISQLSAEVPDFSPSGLSNLGGIRSHGGDGNIDKNAGANAGNATGN
ncbi:hypothetical protein CDD82_6230 [Ophiocordyceps australis]|uniref:HTH La-type RNA-binding domain-containing protein n=1 Tax=Ophiocordyceps australis TaxID=1399860 RepID=A0A2C5YWI0_9HYPO|nr:hypothetical protein CDD82_6230 [Ophiocordyceps australis]